MRRQHNDSPVESPLLPVVRHPNGTSSVKRDPLQVAAFFAGIGGIEAGLHRAGHSTVVMCECDASASAVLSARFPSVKLVGDIRDVRSLPEETELVTAGFPCQDLSQAGMTRGIEGDRSGLVAEVLRLLRRKPARWVLLENVPFMLRLSRGRALDFVLGALEGLGYRWAYRVVDTRSFGLPQRRQRVFILASTDEDPRDVLLADDAGPIEPPSGRPVACGFYWTEGIRGLGWAVDSVPTLKGGSTVGIPSPPGVLMPDGQLVTPDIRDAERLQGFPRDWTKPAEGAGRRSFRWKLVGNAVSVPPAVWIGRRLRRPGSYDGTWDAPLPAGAPWPDAAWNLGRGRRASTVSDWPVRRRVQHLHEFLRYPTEPLSIRAAVGFRSRTRQSSLRFPHGFLDAVDAHIRRMGEGGAHGARVRREASTAR